jgi:3-dehydroquinate dehydratase
VADGTVAGFGLVSYQLALQAIAELAAEGAGEPAQDKPAP